MPKQEVPIAVCNCLVVIDTKLLIMSILVYFDKLMVVDFASPQFYSVLRHYLELLCSKIMCP